jgi:hypothetical protein
MISKNWSHRLFWSLIDMAATNAYVIYRQFHPKTTHSEFFEMLAQQMLDFGRSGGGLNRRSLRSFISECSVDSDSECSLQPSMRSPSPTASAPCVPGKFKGDYRRVCFVCYRKSRFTLGALRSNGKPRKNYYKPNFGCKTCGVALCPTGPCWAEYHTEFTGQTDPACHSHFV